MSESEWCFAYGLILGLLGSLAIYMVMLTLTDPGPGDDGLDSEFPEDQPDEVPPPPPKPVSLTLAINAQPALDALSRLSIRAQSQGINQSLTKFEGVLSRPPHTPLNGLSLRYPVDPNEVDYKSPIATPYSEIRTQLESIRRDL